MLATLLAIDEEPETGEEATPPETTPLKVTSIDIGSTDIDEEEERMSTGQVEPPPSDEEEEEEEEKRIVTVEEREEEEEEGKGEESKEEKTTEENTEGKEDSKEEGENEVTSLEHNESKEEERDTSNDKMEEKVDEEEEKVRTCSLSASEETLKLARQLSKDFQETLSPTGSEDFALPVHNEETSDIQAEEKRREKEVNDNILNAWIPGEWVQQVLASGRIVPPEHLTQPGLISSTVKVRCLILPLSSLSFLFCSFLSPSLSFSIHSLTHSYFLSLFRFLLQCDPIGEVLRETFPGTERRQLLTADQVAMDHHGLISLIVRKKNFKLEI